MTSIFGTDGFFNNNKVQNLAAIPGSTSVSGNLLISGDTNVTGALAAGATTITGGLIADSATVTGGLIAGPANILGTLQVSGRGYVAGVRPIMSGGFTMITPVTVTLTTAETSIIGAGLGSLTAPANTVSLGQSSHSVASGSI